VKGNPARRRGSGPYLVAEDWNADLPFVIDPRVVDLRREFHLSDRYGRPGGSMQSGERDGE